MNGEHTNTIRLARSRTMCDEQTCIHSLWLKQLCHKQQMSVPQKQLLYVCHEEDYGSEIMLVHALSFPLKSSPIQFSRVWWHGHTAQAILAKVPPFPHNLSPTIWPVSHCAVDVRFGV